MAPEQGHELFFRHFAVPMLSGLLRLCANQRLGPDTEQWWQNAFQSWVSFAASKAKISEQTLLTNLANEIDADQRTIERWLSGEPVGKLVSPNVYRPFSPSPVDIDRMLETMRWVQWLDVEQRHLVWMRAKRYGWRDISIRFACCTKTAQRHWQKALDSVVVKLNNQEGQTPSKILSNVG